jgi:hypothetical protein
MRTCRINVKSSRMFHRKHGWITIPGGVVLVTCDSRKAAEWQARSLLRDIWARPAVRQQVEVVPGLYALGGAAARLAKRPRREKGGQRGSR